MSVNRVISAYLLQSHSMLFLDLRRTQGLNHYMSILGLVAMILTIMASPFSSSWAETSKINQCANYLKSPNTPDVKTLLENDSLIGTPEYLDLGKTEVYTIEFSSGLKAIFKPEPKYWVVAAKFKNMNLANPNNEEAAFIVNQALGLSLVPFTLQRTVGQKHGSVQLFVNGVTLSQYQVKNLSPQQKATLKDLHVFDFIIQNADRNQFNILIDGNKIWAIDNGSTFYLSRQITYAPALNETVVDALSFKMWQKLKSTDLNKLSLLLQKLVSQDRIKELQDRILKLVSIGETKFQKEIRAEERKELLRIFTEVFNNPKVYECFYCQKNVSRLFQAFQSEIPNLDPKKFNVLYIANKAVLKEPQTIKGFNVKKARGLSQRAKWGSYPHYRYHVVLEYEGLIYDLDYSKKPNPVKIKTFIDSVFLSPEIVNLYRPHLYGPVTELVAFEIPMDIYLTKSVDELGLWGTHNWIYTTFPAKPLLEYR